MSSSELSESASSSAWSVVDATMLPPTLPLPLPLLSVQRLMPLPNEESAEECDDEMEGLDAENMGMYPKDEVDVMAQQSAARSPVPN